jgi:hypothetical protein
MRVQAFELRPGDMLMYSRDYWPKMYLVLGVVQDENDSSYYSLTYMSTLDTGEVIFCADRESRWHSHHPDRHLKWDKR